MNASSRRLLLAALASAALACAADGDGLNARGVPAPRLDAGTRVADPAPPILSAEDLRELEELTLVEPGIQTLFSINVHDWVFSEESAATLHQVIDLHEAYGVKVDLYLTDPVLQAYLQEDPALIARLKRSPVVAVSYHVRPPAAFYPGFDFVGLDPLSDDELTALLTRYETERTDLVSGLPLTGTQGGYTYVGEIVGYPPLAVGLFTGAGRPVSLLTELYPAMGATFATIHGAAAEYGDRLGDLWLRPEQVEVKLYEYRHGEDAATVLEDELAAQACPTDTGCPDMIYMNIKFHENNWYTTETPWWPVFFEDSSKTTPKAPPFNLEAAEGVITFKSVQERADLWAIYEGAVAYVAAHPQRFRSLNLRDLQQELRGVTAPTSTAPGAHPAPAARTSPPSPPPASP